MEKNEFLRLENACQFRFLEAGTCFHVYSQENHPVLFHNEEEFKAAMNVVAFAGFLFPDICIYTFEIMDNHFHFAMSGAKERISSFVKNFISRLALHPVLSGSAADIRRLSFHSFPLDSLDNLRNVIAYINRNGAVVSPFESAYTYLWGTNRFFFNREAMLRYKESGRIPTVREKRKMFRSNLLAGENKIIVLDGYVSPMSYCYVKEGELFFRNNRHYFYSISRNVESLADIARTIGESIFYSDEDLFVHIRTLCVKKYGCGGIAELPKEARIELAKDLHFNYNAGNKQISRLLKMELSIISALFPK